MAAVKLFHTRKHGAEEAFDNELAMYKSLAALQGLAIPYLLQSGRIKFTDTVFLALSYEGSIIEDAFSRRQIPSSIKEGMANALQSLHRQGVLHGDVRLDNFVSSNSGAHSVRIIDFEYATLIDSELGCSQKTIEELAQVEALCSISPESL